VGRTLLSDAVAVAFFLGAVAFVPDSKNKIKVNNGGQSLP
jgi:hypothetical protein